MKLRPRPEGSEASLEPDVDSELDTEEAERLKIAEKLEEEKQRYQERKAYLIERDIRRWLVKTGKSSLLNFKDK